MLQLLLPLTTFFASFLLFAMQPMVAKLVLPQLGGAASVWNVSMLCFQLFLLVGYGLAHLWAQKRFATRAYTLQAIAVWVVVAFLPLSVSAPLFFSATGQPVLWLMLAYASSIAIPFIVLSVNAPLLQAWLVNTTLPSASRAYTLYAASNAGSLLALLSYPFLVEPLLTLPQQQMLWSMGYGVYAVLFSLSAWILYRAAPRISITASTKKEQRNKLTRLEKAQWVALAFVPSALLMAVTQFIMVDIASFPLMWVIPLSIYLLSFIATFSSSSSFWLGRGLIAQTSLTCMVVFLLLEPKLHQLNISLFAFHLFFLFAACLMCHGRLYALRPDGRSLTEYYIWIALGGVLGGVFTSLLSPALFSSVIEYPLLVVAAYLARMIGEKKAAASPASGGSGLLHSSRDVLIAAATGLGLLLLAKGAYALPDSALQNISELLKALNSVVSNNASSFTARDAGLALGLILLAVVTFFSAEKSLRYALVVALLLIGYPYVKPKNIHEHVLFQGRNFYGVSKVTRYEDANVHVLSHGTTVHGNQQRDWDKHLEPTSYYGEPLRQIFASHPSLRRIGAIGLGTGTLACQASADMQVDFYELNPLMIRIAQNPDWFDYLATCLPQSFVVEGDGRLKLAEAQDQLYDLLILDAYSSDSLPLHLMTREALALYLQKTKPDALIAFHISNRYFDLEPLIASLADEQNLKAAVITHQPKKPWQFESTWLVVTRDEQRLAALLNQSLNWRGLHDTRLRPWTDSYSNLLASFKE